MPIELNLNKVISFLLVFVFLPFYARGENVDQLLQQADHIRSSNPEKSKSILSQIKQTPLAGEQKDKFDYLFAYNISMNGQLNEAVIEFQKLTKANITKEIRIRAMASLLTMYAGTQNWSSGLAILPALLEETKQIKEADLSVNVLTSIAIFYNLIGEHRLAINFTSKILATDPKARAKCIAKTELLVAQLKISPDIISENDFHDNLEFCKSAGEDILIYSVYAIFSEYYFTIKKVDKALEVISSHINEVEDAGYHTLTAAHYQLMAEYYLSNLQPNEAEFYAMKILSGQAQHQNGDAMATAYKVMYLISQQQQDYEVALKYYEKFSATEFAKYTQQNNKFLAIQNAKLDSIEKSNQIALLDKENALLKTQTALDRESAENDRLALALLSVVLILLFFWAYKNRRMHKKLRKLAETDELTGISNRYHFSQLANAAINYGKKSNQSLCFILFDLDFFKKINDNFGHQIGDWALKQVVIAARSVCRNNDVIGRLGGEEFGILLPGCSMEKATALAESCRLAIAAINSAESGHVFSITASFGVADIERCDYDFDKLFAAADTALYQSKDMGRNKVYCYEQDQLTLAIH